ncbi:MAG TPA: hypothetical protein VN767_11050 [Streptosporangiaceae bacterium]|nr:hypothetical protein [Streptosporangiaceae bacterium]
MAEYNGPASGTQIAAWTYDNSLFKNSATVKTRGELSSSTSTPSGPSGPAYTESVVRYNLAYQPTDETQTLPASALVPGQTGNLTFEDTSTYTTLTGEPATTAYGADSGLPQETVSYSFDAMGQETQIAGTDTYLAAARGAGHPGQRDRGADHVSGRRPQQLAVIECHVHPAAATRRGAGGHHHQSVRDFGADRQLQRERGDGRRAGQRAWPADLGHHEFGEVLRR